MHKVVQGHFDKCLDEIPQMREHVDESVLNLESRQLHFITEIQKSLDLLKQHLLTDYSTVSELEASTPHPPVDNFIVMNSTPVKVNPNPHPVEASHCTTLSHGTAIAVAPIIYRTATKIPVPKYNPNYETASNFLGELEMYMKYKRLPHQDWLIMLSEVFDQDKNPKLGIG